MATQTTIKVTADTSQAQGAVKDLDRALSGLQNTGATVSRALLGVTAAAAGVGFAIKSVLDSAGELFDAAAALGMSVQSLQVFQKAAGEVGVSAEALNMSLQKMNANIGDALIKGTGPAVDAFKRLGISLDTINGMKPDKQFELIAKQLNAIPNQAEKSALAMDLFGKQGIKILKIAENLDKVRKKMEELGALITPEQQASLDLAGDAVDNLIGLFSSGLKKAVAELGPYILAFVYTIEDAVKAAGGLDNIMAKLGAVVRYALNVAIIMAFVGGIRLIYTGIVNAQAAFILFNTIVKRSPLFLLVAAAAALAQYFGVDVAGAVGKVFDITDNLGKANTKIAEEAKKIKEENGKSADAVKRGNAEAEKAAANALKALDNTIKKMESENKFMKDKIGLSEQEAAVQKIIRDEQDKLAAVGAKMSVTQLARLTALAEESQELKSQAAFTDTMKALQDDILLLTTAEGVEREKISALLGLEKSMKREATADEKKALDAAIQRKEVLKSIGEQEQQYVKFFDKNLKVAIGLGEKLLQLDIDLAKARENIAKAKETDDIKRAQDTYNAIQATYTGEVLAAADSYSEIGDLHGAFNRKLNALDDVRKRLKADSFLYEFSKRQGMLDAMDQAEKKFEAQYEAEKTAFNIRIAEQEKSLRLSNLQIIRTAELDAARTKYADLAVMEQQHQQALTDIQYQAVQDRVSMELMANQQILSQKISAQDQTVLQAQGANERQKAIVNERLQFEKKSDTEKAAFAIDQGAQMFSALGAQNKEAFEVAKAFNIANAIMNTYMAATKALATYPPPFNFIAMGAAVAMGLAQVAQIRSQQYSGRALGGPVMGGQPYLVGESGPELFTPATTGSITRNGDLGGGGTTNVTFNIQANDTTGFDQLLTSRRGLITTIIADAQLERGRRA